MHKIGLGLVFKATFNNIEVISSWSVLLVGGGRPEYPEKNHQPVARH
jgi:hypothetical protein